jgi:hypothetical protein
VTKKLREPYEAVEVATSPVEDSTSLIERALTEAA